MFQFDKHRMVECHLGCDEAGQCMHYRRCEASLRRRFGESWNRQFHELLFDLGGNKCRCALMDDLFAQLAGVVATQVNVAVMNDRLDPTSAGFFAHTGE